MEKHELMHLGAEFGQVTANIKKV